MAPVSQRPPSQCYDSDFAANSRLQASAIVAVRPGGTENIPKRQVNMPNVSRHLSELINDTVEPEGITHYVHIIPKVNTATQLTLALTIVGVARNENGAQFIPLLQTGAGWLANHIRPDLALALSVAADQGGKIAMKILRRIIKPLLAEREQFGREQGIEQAAAVYEQWIQRQRDAGVTFNEAIPEPSGNGNGKTPG